MDDLYKKSCPTYIDGLFLSKGSLPTNRPMRAIRRPTRESCVFHSDGIADRAASSRCGPPTQRYSGPNHEGPARSRGTNKISVCSACAGPTLVFFFAQEIITCGTETPRDFETFGKKARWGAETGRRGGLGGGVRETTAWRRKREKGRNKRRKTKKAEASQPRPFELTSGTTSFRIAPPLDQSRPSSNAPNGHS